MKIEKTRFLLLVMTAAITAALFALVGCSSDDPAEPSDGDPPMIETVAAMAPNQVTITFNEPVEKASAENGDNYVIDLEAGNPVAHQRMKWEKPRPMPAAAAPLTVVSAVRQENERTVIVTTQGMDLFGQYDVQVSGVKDLAGNTIGATSKSVENLIRSGRIFTIAGTGFPALGGEDMDPALSDLYLPIEMSLDPNGSLVILDWNNHRVRIIEDGLIRTILGTGLLGDAEPGPGLEVGLNHPTSVAFDSDGMLILGAWHNSKILRMDMNTLMVEVICAWTGQRGYFGDGGPAYDAILNLPAGVAIDQEGRILIADQANHRVRRMANDLENTISTVVGTGTRGYCGDGGPATEACLDGPTGQNAFPASKIEFDKDYNLYLADTRNNVIRRVDGETWTISTVAGNGTEGYAGDGGDALSAEFDYPADVAIGPDGAFYVADTENDRIRKTDTNGVITTVAGTGEHGYNGDGIRATDAKLKHPFGVMIDAEGNIYIADTKNHRIRIVYK